mgnify:CR=1 FL=1
MKAVIQATYGTPRNVLRIVDVPAETPAADEVIIRMEAAALHIADLRTVEGDPDFQFPLPRSPGFEGIGHVVRVGAAVTEFKVGDRVFPALASGTFREEVRCKAAGCLPAPEGDAIQLSLLTVNGSTAEVLLNDFADLAPGDWLIQNAANSSCGRYLIRLAKLKGVRTVNVVRRPEMVAELQELGGDVVLIDGPDLAARVTAAVQGAPIKVGIDAVAGAATQRIAECLAPGSTVASYGSMSAEPCHLDFYLMFKKDIRLIGVAFIRQFQLRRTPEQVKSMYARLAGHIASGEMRAKIAGVYPLEQIVDACERAGRTGAERDGKVVIRIS